MARILLHSVIPGRKHRPPHYLIPANLCSWGKRSPPSAGKNSYCTHIGNESFAWFSSTQSKSRINFLELLPGAALDYTINDAANVNTNIDAWTPVTLEPW
jgi:hypothetical protein